jgi:O-antigen ligase
MLFSVLLIIIFIIALFIKSSKNIKYINITIIIFLLAFLGALSAVHIQKNDAWKYFFADAKVSLQINEYDNWKYAGEKGYPPNELKRLVTPTNYERIVWAIVGAKLVYENPFGYGLIENSFRPVVNKKWPESSKALSHSHSGWIDLALGIGIPGFCLIFFSLLIASGQSLRTPLPWAILGVWVLPALGLAWITTELSNSGSFDSLIFFIVLVSAINSASHIKPNIALSI